LIATSADDQPGLGTAKVAASAAIFPVRVNRNLNGDLQKI
jgi:hypothetical protein